MKTPEEKASVKSTGKGSSFLSALRQKLLGNDSDQMYRSIFENAIEGIFQTTPSGGYLNVNPALAKMYGYESPQALIAGLTAIDNHLYVDPPRRGDFVKIMAEAGSVRGFEAQIYRKDRSTMWI